MNNVASLSGLQLGQRERARLEHNIANSQNPDHISARTGQSSIVLNGVGSGVKSTTEVRLVPQPLIEARRAAVTQAQSAQVLATGLEATVGLLGNLDDGTAITDQFSNFLAQLSGLGSGAEEMGDHKEILQTFSVFCQQLNMTAGALQEQQAQADQHIADHVTQANALLKQLESLNEALPSGGVEGLNTRDRLLKELSAILPIRTSFEEKGRVNISTHDSQYMLLCGKHRPTLSFTRAVAVGPDTLLGHGFSGVSLGNNPAQDLTKALQGGSLAGHLEMRDVKLVQLQRELDAFASQLRITLNTASNRGAGAEVAATLRATRVVIPGDAFDGVGTIQFFVVSGQDQKVMHRHEMNLSHFATFEALQGALNDLDGIQASFEGGRLTLKAGDEKHGILITPVKETPQDYGQVTIGGVTRGLSEAFGFNDLLVSGFEGAGSALTLKLGPAVQTGMLPTIQPNIEAELGGLALDISNLDGLARFHEVLGDKITFDDAGTLPSNSDTLPNFLAGICARTSKEAHTAKENHNLQRHYLERFEKEVQSLGGVDLKSALTEIRRWMSFEEANAAALSATYKMMENFLNLLKH